MIKNLIAQLRKVWNFIDKLNSLVKTLIIILLGGLIYTMYIGRSYESLLTKYTNNLQLIDLKADLYTLKIAPRLTECITFILKSDPDCYNVLLLNYHNSKKSLQGIRYLYLNCIVEAPKGIEDEPVKRFWNDLEYIYYEDELSRIHNSGYLRVDDINSIKTTFPKLYRLLVASGALSAAFYPIEGLDSPIGIVIVLYKNKKLYELGYYNKVIAPLILKLSILLDYPNLNSVMQK